jgi:hypothetical protein
MNVRKLFFASTFTGVALGMLGISACNRTEDFSNEESTNIRKTVARTAVTEADARRYGVSLAGVYALTRMKQSEALDQYFNFTLEGTDEQVALNSGAEDQALMQQIGATYQAFSRCPPPKIFCPQLPTSLASPMQPEPIPVSDVENAIILVPADNANADIVPSLQLISLEDASYGKVIADSRLTGSTTYIPSMRQKAVLLGSIAVPGSSNPFSGTARFCITVKQAGKVIYDHSTIVAISR